MNKLIILGVAVVALLYIFVSSIFVVNEREQAIVMRFGQITDVKTTPVSTSRSRPISSIRCRSSKIACCATTSPT